ncbi:hypothetical protein MRB53_042308 [Persea americana]|nr:hypothetical protein MRB53_042308 [Persea americana]
MLDTQRRCNRDKTYRKSLENRHCMIRSQILHNFGGWVLWHPMRSLDIYIAIRILLLISKSSSGVSAVITEQLFKHYHLNECYLSDSDSCCSDHLDEDIFKEFYEDLEPGQPFPPVESIEMYCDEQVVIKQRGAQDVRYRNNRTPGKMIWVCRGHCRDIRPRNRLRYQPSPSPVYQLQHGLSVAGKAQRPRFQLHHRQQREKEIEIPKSLKDTVPKGNSDGKKTSYRKHLDRQSEHQKRVWKSIPSSERAPLCATLSADQLQEALISSKECMNVQPSCSSPPERRVIIVGMQESWTLDDLDYNPQDQVTGQVETHDPPNQSFGIDENGLEDAFRTRHPSMTDEIQHYAQENLGTEILSEDQIEWELLQEHEMAMTEFPWLDQNILEEDTQHTESTSIHHRPTVEGCSWQDSSGTHDAEASTSQAELSCPADGDETEQFHCESLKRRHGSGRCVESAYPCDNQPQLVALTMRSSGYKFDQQIRLM